MAQRLTSLLEQPATSPLGVSAVTLSGGAQRYALAWRIANGKDKVHDPAEADYWLRLAAADGEVNALVDLGKRVVNSQRSTQGNPEAARLLWWVAAAHNEPIAMFNLGSMYEHGVGVTADVISARKWYQRSAALSHALASDALRRLGP
jgi:TPR repeat protein